MKIMNKIIQIGKIYKHYKGKCYRILHVGHDTTNLLEHVVYEALYTDPVYGKNHIWIRPLSEFFESVEYGGAKHTRFILENYNSE